MVQSPIAVQDREQLASFRQGDRAAMEHVYRQFVAEVTAFLRRGFMYRVDTIQTRFPGVRDAIELESLVQEVFARAFEPRARTAYDGLRPYGPFLIGIARHVVLDHLRANVRHGEVIVSPPVLDETVASPEVPEHERRARELVATFLADECDDRDRELYELRYQRELSQSDAAAAAGLSRIQIRRWETTLRKRLLRFLKRADYVRRR